LDAVESAREHAVYASHLYAIAPNARPEIVKAIVSNGPRLLIAYGADKPLRLVHFIAQTVHESQGLTRLEENLNYSASRLCEVWPNRFPTLASAAPFAHNPQALANKVYGGRLGNSGPDDGWRYRGRALIGLTGRANYQTYGRVVGVDIEAEPDRAAEPVLAFELALAFFRRTGCLTAADRDNVSELTRLINGGTNGLADREALTAIARDLLLPDRLPRRTLRTGTRGNDVRLLQGELVELSTRMRPDGVFGPATETAIRAFQKARALNPDGVVGPMTRAALDRALMDARLAASPAAAA
jgi:putative chitinase